MSLEKISTVMAKYVPTAAVEVCSRWIMEKNIHLKITRGRASKFGDYRPMEKGRAIALPLITISISLLF
ncbi:MAG: hypothetical protein U0X76_04465 [Bacteroidia bacterium]